jgi:methylated-DNA-[protein]-cysteine S-methyltransferase
MLRISAQAEVICSVLFDESSAETHLPEEFSSIVKQFEEYFSGKRQTFDFDLIPGGTPFQLAVWEIVMDIPYGKTRSYGEIAQQMGLKNGARAVGLAVGANPLLIVVPCHRVVGSNGQLTGYAGGIDRKKWLLRHEAANLPFQLKA